ncbi:type I glyceraldehyde-3-phosphate dehydrogenase [Marinobacter sp.]|uniref:type I glyceraldehyde-3-phosphate dehydrogenase n=1 Tax=Marinobacter sp. TaxID=50741 RepID=UPI003A956317
MINVAINGMGRIGRAALKVLEQTGDFEVVAINDLTPLDNLVYLLRYDSVYGRFERTIDTSDNDLLIDGRRIRAFNEKNPGNLPWRDMGIDVVFECTGAFRQRDDLVKHLDAGARHVILSAPGKGGHLPSVVFGVNDLDEENSSVFSTASCTTNCIAPVAEIMARRIGVRKAVMTTIHAYTSSQGIVDSPSKQPERGRAAGVNLIPTSTGAATATAEVLPDYKGHFDGMAVRVPIPVGSLADITFVTERSTTVDEITSIFSEEARSDRYHKVLGVSSEPIVSSDIIQDPRASIVDLTATKVVDGDLVKIMSWYDNEWGYVCQMVRQARELLR